MKIIKAKYIITCNDEFDILQNMSIAFDEIIRSIGKFDELVLMYPDAEIFDFSNDIITAAFINPHTHLEFSSNVSSLDYGDFLLWLKSVISFRDSLSDEAKNLAMKEAITSILKSGVSTIGEISSFGKDIEICANSKARFVFFNEILGTNDKAIDECFDKFMTRFNASLEYKSDKFIPAVSVHSPYSTHPELTKKALNLAREKDLLVSTHFLESKQEKMWLESGSGEFKSWLSSFTSNPTPLYSPSQFLANFSGIRTLFTHCVWSDDYLEFFDKNLHSVTTCAVSNRLLGQKKLNLNKIIEQNLSLNIATDGLSSNISLNFFDELRAFLWTHCEFELNFLAKFAILASTNWVARALNLNLGILSSGRIADIAVYKGLDVRDSTQLATELILHTKEVKKLFIKGDECKF